MRRREERRMRRRRRRRVRKVEMRTRATRDRNAGRSMKVKRCRDKGTDRERDSHRERERQSQRERERERVRDKPNTVHPKNAHRPPRGEPLMHESKNYTKKDGSKINRTESGPASLNTTSSPGDGAVQPPGSENTKAPNQFIHIQIRNKSDCDISTR